MTFSGKPNSRLKLFSLLAEAGPRMVPGAYLKEKLGMSRQAVFKLIGALREEGLDIESVPQKGYALKNLRETGSLSPTLIDYLLMDNQMYRECLCFSKVDSTQRILKSMAAQDAPEGIVAAADRQTQGRGRRDRSWYSPHEKNLCFSTLLRPKIAPGDVQLLNLAAGIAVRGVLREYYSVAAELKWPNDVTAGGKKICGILSEAAGEPDRIYYAITGIGVNVNLTLGDMPPEIAETATSILIENRKKTARPFLLAQIFSSFSGLVARLRWENGKASLLETYRKVCSTIGREVSVTEDEKEFTGVAKGVTEQGAIIVNVDGADRVFAAADVHHLRLTD